jgi:methyl-accepting chemotaxis protein
MKKFNFSTQLTLCFVTPAVLFIAALAATFWGLWTTQADYHRLISQDQAIATELNELRASALQANQALRDMALDVSNKDAAASMKSARATLATSMAHAQQLAVGTGFAEPMTQIDTMLKAQAEMQDKIVKMVRDSPGEVIMAIVDQETPLWAKARTALLKQVQIAVQSSEAAQARTRNAGTRALLLAAVLAAIAVASSVVLNLVMTRSVRRELGGDPTTAREALRRVADGDLREDLAVHPSATDSVIGNIQKMQESLRRMVTQMRASTDSIGTASSEIATGNQDLSARTEQTASNLQQAASSMEQLTGTVKQSADSARQADQLASSAAEVAGRGGKVVSEVVSTMDEINTSSKKIADIIGVIDGIAFQTNILALNAAVEAARAGEQGRGFAVVASEVRNLAQRSAQAAKEIKGLISASVDKVESGSKLVAHAGATMNEIVSSVQRVTDIIGEITAASAEQSDGIGEINVAVVQLDKMTQQNAALVEESAAAAESLKQQAQSLAKVVGTFRLDGNAPAAAQAAPATAARAPLPKSAPPAAASAVVARAKASAAAAVPSRTATTPGVPAMPSPPAQVPVLSAAVAVPAGKPASDDDWETF